MLRLIATRLVIAIPTLFAVITLTFIMIRLAPGSPFDGERPLDAPTRAALDAAYGINRPLLVQFGDYLSHIARFDFGPSMVYRDFSVTQLVVQGLPVSLTLGGVALLLASMAGIASAVVATRWSGGWPDAALGALATILTALPSFVSAPLLVLLFALTLGWLPVGGWGGVDHIVLPGVALALPVAGAIHKLLRAALADQMRGDNIRTARARGLTPFTIITRHALRPALIPVASYLAPAAAGLLTGAVVIETIFALPGLGRYFVQGALNRDYPLVMAVVILYAALIILFNLLADLAYGWLDPRIRG
ncbi:MAG: ABC transporter permease [Alphaproteobacteria bacterium]|nr:ABC transporter permease [Alphaproteobacteria bacterium]MDE2042085.1 ABC transporter permease [Alphaproteobacteria bacterium]MDE2340944.1 ABC transporter permease [Alphaproteobacteria bacterium]